MSSILSKLINLAGNITGTLAVANGGTGVTTSTGSVNNVLSTSPTLVTPILGAATATSVTFSPTTGGIVGTTTNDNASAGTVGESQTSFVNDSTITLSTGTPANATSINLTAGDWDVTGFGVFSGTITGTLFIAGVSSTSATIPTLGNAGNTRAETPTAPTVNADVTLAIPTIRVSLSGSATYYLVLQATFSVGTLKGGGRISARRVR